MVGISLLFTYCSSHSHSGDLLDALLGRDETRSIVCCLRVLLAINRIQQTVAVGSLLLRRSTVDPIRYQLPIPILLALSLLKDLSNSYCAQYRVVCTVVVVVIAIYIAKFELEVGNFLLVKYVTR